MRSVTHSACQKMKWQQFKLRFGMGANVVLGRDKNGIADVKIWRLETQVRPAAIMGKSRGAGCHGRCARVASEPFRGEVWSPSGARFRHRPGRGWVGGKCKVRNPPTRPPQTVRSARGVPPRSPAGPVAARHLVVVATVIWGTTDPPRRRWPKGCAKISDNFANDSEGGQGRSQGLCGRTWRKSRSLE